MTVRKTTLIILILLTALVVWVPAQWRLHQTRQALADAATQQAALEQQIAGAETDMEEVRQQITAGQRDRARGLAEEGIAREALAKVRPESNWTVPPATLPEWNAESPFIWMRKEALPTLPVPAFLPDGELRPEVATVLSVPEIERRELNAALRQCLDQYREIEKSKVERLDQHLAGIEGQDGGKYSIRVPALPEEGARAKEQFASALTGTLGEQRAGLLLQLAAGWLDQQFSQGGQEPKTISLLVRPQGGYNVSIQTGGSWFNTSVDPSRPEMIWHYIPEYLAPLFEEVLGGTSAPPASEVNP